MNSAVFFLSGAYTLGSLAIAVAFHRMLQRTGDRLFGWFAAAFVLLSCEHIFMLFVSVHALDAATSPYCYGVRLSAFILLLIAIGGKNFAFKAWRKKEERVK